MASSSQGQTSSYYAMTLAGEWQNWDPSANNLLNYSNYAWEGIFFLSARQTNYFKFTANSQWGVREWGETNQTLFADPFTSTGEISGGSANIKHVAIRDGFYRFRLNETSNVYSVELVGYSYSGDASNNLLRNATFETPGSTSYDAAQWEASTRNRYGGRYGAASRQDWRFHSPQYEATVGTSPNFGGWYQEAAGGFGFDYEASCWFWADDLDPYGPWTAGVAQLKIEFYSPTYGSPIATYATNLGDIGETWTQYTVRAAAPTNTAWARAVVSVANSGTKGSLQIDDIALRSIPLRSQGFDTWSFATNAVGTHARGGWLAQTGRVWVISNLVSAGRFLALQPGGSLTSPDLGDGGIGRITFTYCNSITDEVPTNAVGFTFDNSPDGVSFSEVTSVVSILDQSFKEFSYPQNDLAQRYIRIRHTSGTNALYIDSITVGYPTTSSPYQDCETPGWSSTNTCQLLEEWYACSGRVFTAGAYAGSSLELGGTVAGWSNSLRSPLFSEGFGNVSFALARGTNGTGPATLLFQESADGTTWSTVAAISNITATGWTLYDQYFYQPAPRYLRFVNASAGSAGGSGSILIQEAFAAAPTAPEGWTFTGVSAYTSESSSGLAPNSVQFNSTGDQVVTPTLTSPTGLVFWAKGNSLSGSSLLIEALVTGSWVTVTNMTALSNSESTNAMTVSTNSTQLRFTYTKSAGNLAFDDVTITGLGSGPQPAQGLRLDNIVVGEPQEFRTQDFDAWPNKPQYAAGTHVFQGWSITNAIVDDEKALDGQVLRLHTDLNNYIRSPYFPEGIGVIEFSYANWGGSAIGLFVQYSTNGTSWTTITNLSLTSTAYQTYQKYLNVTNPAWFRLFHSSGAERALIDNISIGKPQPPALCDINGYHLPSAPFTNDAVTLWAALTPSHGAFATNVACFFRVGTNGIYTNLTMLASDVVTYYSSTSIPPKTTGTVVQYYMRVDYGGPGAELTSPRYYPTNWLTASNPASYTIPRRPVGQVWINEVKYNDSLWVTTNDFIELAGPTGFNLSGWSVELYQGTSNRFAALFDRYVIATPTILPPDTASIGFWVLGQTSVSNVDRALTNSMSDRVFSGYGIGIKLLNEGGGLEQALCFDSSLPFFTRVAPVDDPFESEYSMQLQGQGLSYTNFTWLDNPTNRTPGAVNFNQFFGLAMLTNVWFEYIGVGSNVTLISLGNSNNLPSSIYYSTNLYANPQVWLPLSSYTTNFANGTNTYNFVRPVAPVPHYFKLGP